jgi:hypothetical protein
MSSVPNSRSGSRSASATGPDGRPNLNRRPRLVHGLVMRRDGVSRTENLVGSRQESGKHPKPQQQLNREAADQQSLADANEHRRDEECKYQEVDQGDKPHHPRFSCGIRPNGVPPGGPRQRKDHNRDDQGASCAGGGENLGDNYCAGTGVVSASCP